jgi:hypothetical protein
MEFLTFRRQDALRSGSACRVLGESGRGECAADCVGIARPDEYVDVIVRARDFAEVEVVRPSSSQPTVDARCSEPLDDLSYESKLSLRS